MAGRTAVGRISLSSLEKKLDRVLSVYIRRKDADVGGTVRCCTCPKLMHWSESHCGHWIKRQHRSVRWDERNLGVQCPRCNVFMGGCQDEFAQHIVAQYGLSVFNELLALKHKPYKVVRGDLERLIAHYTAQVKALDLKAAA